MFTDIVGSSALKVEHGDANYVEYVAKPHNRIFREILGRFPGALENNYTGDGFLATFERVSDAVNAALLFHHALRAYPWSPKLKAPVQTCVGIHLGESVLFEGPEPGKLLLASHAADMCARLMSLAAGGQTLLTRAAFDNARQYVREHPAISVVGCLGSSGEERAASPQPVAALPPAGVSPTRPPATPSDTAALPELEWLAHGRYLFKGKDEPMEVFEVGAVGLAPLRAPGDSAKAKRALSIEEEQTLGWRSGLRLEIPGKPGWVIDRKLGEGGFGEVWLVGHAKTKLERVFTFCFDPDRLRSFKREPRLGSAL
jgi:class 3 adenylate cyclase